jgi:hypothetical protein
LEGQKEKLAIMIDKEKKREQDIETKINQALLQIELLRSESQKALHTLHSTYASLSPLLASLPRTPSPTFSTFLLTLSLPFPSHHPSNLVATLRQRLHEFTPEDHLSDELVDTVVMPYWRGAQGEVCSGGVEGMMRGFICACGEYWVKERMVKG